MSKDIVDDDEVSGACADCSCCLKTTQKGRIRRVADLFFLLGGIECLYFFVIAIASCIILQFSDVAACDQPLLEWVFTTIVVYYVFVIVYQFFFFDLFGACLRTDVWFHFWYIGFHIASFAWSIVGIVWFFKTETGKSTHLYRLCYVYTVLFLIAAGIALVATVVILVCWCRGKWLWAAMPMENWEKQQQENREAEAKKKFDDQQALLRAAESARAEAEHAERVQKAFEEKQAREQAEREIKEAQEALQRSIRLQAERRASEAAAEQRAQQEKQAAEEAARRNAEVLAAAKEEEKRKAAEQGQVVLTAAQYAAQQAAKPAAPAAAAAAEEDFEI